MASYEPFFRVQVDESPSCSDGIVDSVCVVPPDLIESIRRDIILIGMDPSRAGT